jgi:hypothetical protein
MVDVARACGVLSLLLVTSGCARAPGPRAEQLGAADRELVKRLAPAPGTWAQEGDWLTSPGWRSARMGPFYEVGTRLPQRADGVFEIGVGQSPELTIKLTPVGARHSMVEDDAGRASYRLPYPATDLVFVSTAQRVEWFLVLDDPAAPSEFVWKLDLPNGLPQVKADASGSLMFTDAGGTARLRMPRPYAIDARGVRRDATLRYDDGRLTLALDERGLTFPVLLDPAVETVTWTEVVTNNGPLLSGKILAGLAYDSGRGVTVQYGGTYNGTSGMASDTWEWNGSTWTQRTTTGPGPRYGHAMAYDSARGVTVMFGGTNGTTVFGDTWEWNGTTWKQRTTTGPARELFGMVYDSAHAVTVLFGGYNNGGLGDTWTWNGTTWSQKCSACTIPARLDFAMAYDSVRSRTVAFGGHYGGTLYNDTWEWDGSAWTQSMPSSSPQGRVDHALAFDSVRQRVVLFGGNAGFGNNYLNDTWEWDGTSWLQRFPALSPDPRFEHAMVFDSQRGRLVLYSGSSGPNPFADTWEYHVRGGPCSSGTQCDTGHCVDGVCCEQASCGTCSACNLADPGNCTPVTNAQDADTCTGTKACDASGACVAQKPIGGTCTAGVLCQSGFCAEGTCCMTACNGVCDSCAATPGTCTAVVSADDADSCTGTMTCNAASACKLKNGQPCGTNGTLCASGFCSDGVCCSGACSEGCDVCTAALGASADGVCTILPAGAPGANPSCAPYLCNGGASCPASCASDGECVGGDYCASDGTCQTRKGLGKTCGAADCMQPPCNECLTGHCVDGVCCNGSCSTACAVCAKALGAASDGTCSPAPAGNAGRPACGINNCNGASLDCPLMNTCTADKLCASGYYCAQNGTCQPQKTQGMACDSSSSGDCLNADCPVCGTPGGCVTGVCCATTCTGACQICSATPGVCTAAAKGYAGTPSCAPFVCDGAHASCPTSCIGNGDCAVGELCLSGTCSTQAPNGGQCSIDLGCMSGHCVDGICCDTACAGGCFSCSLPGQVGTCTQLAAGSTCGGGDPVCGGTCSSNGTCVLAPPTQRCDVCKRCDGAGRCAQPLDDDDACGVVACAGLSTECLQFADLTTMRCASVGLCAAPNDPATCRNMTPAADGTPCSTGVCMGGQCVAQTPGGGGGAGTGGCSFAPTATAPTPWFLLLAAIFFGLRARSSRSRPEASCRRAWQSARCNRPWRRIAGRGRG